MIAGPNGSGKSTLIDLLGKAGIVFGEYLNADDIARTLSGTPQEAALAAQVQVRERRQQALDERRDHSFETVLSHPSHLDHLKLARQAGFDIIVYFVATDDPAINAGRVANRVVHGGHDVPQDRIETRYHRSLANLRLALPIANEAAVFDNSLPDDPMRMLATFSDGRMLQVIEEAQSPIWWRQFLRDRLADISPIP
jgi:predicted ABC-type ATPase